MMKLFLTLKKIDNVILFIGKICSFLLYGVMAIIVFELIVRNFFNAPTEWAHESSTLVYGIFFVLGGGFTLIRGDHVKMDALYSRFSLRGRATLDVITYFLFALYLVILIWYGGAAGWHSFFIDERSDTVFGPPMWPTKLAVFFGAIFLFIAGTTKFIRDLTTLVLGKKVD